jgi:hypothetical protein
MASKHNWVGRSCLDSEIQSGGAAKESAEQRISATSAPAMRMNSCAEWEFASPAGGSINAWSGDAGVRPETVRPDGDPNKMERSTRARPELRNAWPGAKVYREALLPEWAIQVFRRTKIAARARIAGRRTDISGRATVTTDIAPCGLWAEVRDGHLEFVKRATEFFGPSKLYSPR